MRAMERLQNAYPDDMEARAFHALAILGSRDGVRDFATYVRAAATVQPVFDANPDHPGAAHYLIHSFDDPVHAPLGLPAARKYSSIAPAAAHAQHMTSHIFVALGMWDDVVKANERARDEQNAEAVKRSGRPGVCGHYTSWLQYGYLMQGQTAKAEAMMDECFERMSAKPSPSEIAYFTDMRARQILDTQNWALASRWLWPATTAATPVKIEYDFTNAFAALQRGDAAPARAFVAQPEPADADRRPYFQELRGPARHRRRQVGRGHSSPCARPLTPRTRCRSSSARRRSPSRRRSCSASSCSSSAGKTRRGRRSSAPRPARPAGR